MVNQSKGWRFTPVNLRTLRFGGRLLKKSLKFFVGDLGDLGDLGGLANKVKCW